MSNFEPINPNEMELHDSTGELTFDTMGCIDFSTPAVREQLRDWQHVSSMHPLETDITGQIARAWIARLTWRHRDGDTESIFEGLVIDN